VEPLRTLCQVQNEIGADGESRFLELFQAALNYVRIAVNEKDAKGAASVRARTFRPKTPPGGLEFVLSKVRHGMPTRTPSKPPKDIRMSG